MQYDRYLDSWQYSIKGTPIENLMFDITVHRAPILNENDKKLVCQRRFIPWAQKVFSPLELVQMYNGVYSHTGSGSAAEEQLRRLLEPFPGNDPETKMKAYLQRVSTASPLTPNPAAGATSFAAADGNTNDNQNQNNANEETSFLNTNDQQQQQGGGNIGNENQDNNNLLLAPTNQQQQQQQQVNFHIFTRPPAETFMHPNDTACEVIPPQPITNLTAHILRLQQQQEQQQQQIQAMNLAPGTVVSSSVGNAPSSEFRYDVPTAATESSMFFMLGTGFTTTPPEGSTPGLPARFYWTGGEEVLIQLVRLPDSTLITRPSLMEEHVLNVDENWITTFTIELSQMRSGCLALVENVVGKQFLTTKSVLVDASAADFDDADYFDNDDEDEEEDANATNQKEEENEDATAVSSSSASSKKKKSSDKKSKNKKSSSVAADDKENVSSPKRSSSSKEKKDEESEKRWRAVKSDVVKRGIVLDLAKRAQSPSAPDAFGKVGTVRMLRQALGVHDVVRDHHYYNQQASAAVSSISTSSTTNETSGEKGGVLGFKSGAEIFGGENRAKEISPARGVVATGLNYHQSSTGSMNQQTTTLFVPMPSSKQVKRVHFFVTLENIFDIERDCVFARCTWVLPPAGCVLDSVTDRKCGVREIVQLTSQTAFASRHLNEHNHWVTQHNINLPIELHCLMSQEISPGTPRLVIEVFSGGDGNGPQTLEGYALVTCSPVPGTTRMKVDMWRPQMSGWEQLKAIFVGGSASLVDREAVAVPYSQLSTEAANLEATVRRHYVEQVATNAAMGTEQDQQRLQQLQELAATGDENASNTLQAQIKQMQQQAHAVRSAPLKDFPEEVEREIAVASSFACNSRAGLLTTSEGSVELSVMCFVQQQS